MVKPNNKNQRVIFSKDTAPTIFALLKKYGLEETPDEAFKKLKRGKSPQRSIISHIAKEATQDKISAKDLVSSLQKSLDISKHKAENLAEDIRKELLVLVEKTSKGELKISEKPSVLPKIKVSIPPKKTSITRESSIVKKPPTVEKPEKSSKEPDTYREQIE